MVAQSKPMLDKFYERASEAEERIRQALEEIDYLYQSAHGSGGNYVTTNALLQLRWILKGR